MLETENLGVMLLYFLGDEVIGPLSSQVFLILLGFYHPFVNEICVEKHSMQSFSHVNYSLSSPLLTLSLKNITLYRILK
jgi:hypothetical protein